MKAIVHVGIVTAWLLRSSMFGALDEPSGG